jgi:hypothetical protein
MTGLPAALKNTHPDQDAAASRSDPTCSSALRDGRCRSGEKRLVQRAQSGDFQDKRHATWGMSDQTSGHLELKSSPASSPRLVGKALQTHLRALGHDIQGRQGMIRPMWRCVSVTAPPQRSLSATEINTFALLTSTTLIVIFFRFDSG